MAGNANCNHKFEDYCDGLAGVCTKCFKPECVVVRDFLLDSILLEEHIPYMSIVGCHKPITEWVEDFEGLDRDEKNSILSNLDLIELVKLYSSIK